MLIANEIKQWQIVLIDRKEKRHLYILPFMPVPS